MINGFTFNLIWKNIFIVLKPNLMGWSGIRQSIIRTELNWKKIKIKKYDVTWLI